VQIRKLTLTPLSNRSEEVGYMIIINRGYRKNASGTATRLDLLSLYATCTFAPGAKL